MTRERWDRVLLAGIALSVFAADQVSKYLVLRYLKVGESWNPVPLLRGLFSVTHVVNSGAAFGLFPDQGTLFVVIAVVVVVAIVAYYRYLPTDRWLVRASLGLQLGGALGNLLDRLHYGYVVDFIDFKVWPVFNLADSAIVIGVAVLAYYLLREKEGVRDEEPAAQEEMGGS
ncbi:MAG: signal peptidase II [Anaerolineae bacterium]